jgi:hypothetical protein
MLHKIQLAPFSRINDQCWVPARLERIISHEQVPNFELDCLANRASTHHQFLDLQQSFLYVCTETVFNYPDVYLTEKTYKGITAKRPFVLLAAPGSLQLLKQFGFKTFDRWWDESYDLEARDHVRLLKVYAIIKKICSHSIDELKLLLSDMEETLEYNFHHYEQFGLDQIEDFRTSCILNLKR